MGKRSNNYKANGTANNTEEYRFLNTKDRIAERKSRGIKDTDRYCYQTAPRVQVAKHKRDNDGFFMPDVMFRPYNGAGLLCAVLGETPAHKAADLRAMQDMLAKEAYEHEIELLMCQARARELQFHKRFCVEDRAEEHYAKAVAAGKHPEEPKMTSEDTRQTILKAVTWKFDWIQHYKKKCYQFAEILIDAAQHRMVTDRVEKGKFADQFVEEAARMPEPNRRLLDCMYEAAWYAIYMFKYSMDEQKVPEPWYEKFDGDENVDGGQVVKKGRVSM